MFAEKVNIFYDNVIIRLEKENTSVIKKFEKRLETNRELYDEEDVENALEMPKCAIHRRRMCTDNYIYFKNMIINELCIRKKRRTIEDYELKQRKLNKYLNDCYAQVE